MEQLSLTDDRLTNPAEMEHDVDAQSNQNNAAESPSNTESESEVIDAPTVETEPAPATAAGDAIDQQQRSVPSRDELGPVAEHPAVSDVAITDMELETNADGWSQFPHPEQITAYLDEDMDADRATFPDEMNDAIDAITDDPDLGEFLVMDAEAVYNYLETLQWKSDLHLENFHRRQLIVNQLSGGRGYAKGSSLSTYDKKWICEWEVRRRLAERDLEKWGDESKLTNENHGLPNADE